MKKLLCLLLIIFSFIFVGCDLFLSELEITNGNSLIIEVGESVQLNIEDFKYESEVKWESDNSCVIVDENGLITGIAEGTGTIIVSYNEYKDTIIIEVVDLNKVEINLTVSNSEIKVGETAILSVTLNSDVYNDDVVYEIVNGNDFASLNRNIITGVAKGTVIVVAKAQDYISNYVFIEVVDEVIESDPYTSITKEEFYLNYSEATSYTDSYYRTLHGFMSGSIDDQDQKPTLSSYQPKENGLYIRNSNAYYSSDGNIYYIVDGYGNIVDQVYKGGAYVTLEEVAAYVFAFGEIPANYISKKSANPQSNIWGEYLRLNHSKFSGSTYKYPYEPELPNINGCGGELQYYEMDLGTTGTDCDPSYDIKEYNDGREITRGAARIVYARYDKNGDLIIDINEKYLFYTYNHYNDFQEYLNYQGGWGEMFGNITGGGTLSSKNNYNPTPYVETILRSFCNTNLNIDYTTYNKFLIILTELDKKKYLIQI